MTPLSLSFQWSQPTLASDFHLDELRLQRDAGHTLVQTSLRLRRTRFAGSEFPYLENDV